MKKWIDGRTNGFIKQETKDKWINLYKYDETQHHQTQAI